MGAPQRIFRLYRVSLGSPARHLLVKAGRPEFSNWSQTAEDTAIDELERRLQTIVDREVGTESNVEVIATWESGLPEGDCFYGAETGLEVEIWYALDEVHPGYFVFGSHPDEAAFWETLEELAREGECCPITDYARPAIRTMIRFVQ